MSTCNQLILETLGPQPIIYKKNIPGHWLNTRDTTRVMRVMMHRQQWGRFPPTFMLWIHTLRRKKKNNNQNNNHIEVCPLQRQ